MKIIVSDTSIDGVKQDEMIFKLDSKDTTLFFKDDRCTLISVKGNLQYAISLIDKWFPEV